MFTCPKVLYGDKRGVVKGGTAKTTITEYFS